MTGSLNSQKDSPKPPATRPDRQTNLPPAGQSPKQTPARRPRTGRQTENSLRLAIKASGKKKSRTAASLGARAATRVREKSSFR